MIEVLRASILFCIILTAVWGPPAIALIAWTNYRKQKGNIK